MSINGMFSLFLLLWFINAFFVAFLTLSFAGGAPFHLLPFLLFSISLLTVASILQKLHDLYHSEEEKKSP